MTPRSGSTVFVAMPVFRGSRFLPDTLPSVLGQTHQDLRLMISVDGNDSESAAACEPYRADPRVRLVVQDRQLGWVGNMNWLIDACDGDYFCYWQQDDRCAPDYFEKLVQALVRLPDAAGSYSDLLWFGGRSDEVALPSNIGFTQQRILSAIHELHWLPLRALVTAEALRRVGPIRGLEDTIAFSDYLWVLRLAVAGDLIRVPEVLYFKLEHKTSASKTPSGDFLHSEREAWLMLGAEIFAEVSPRFERPDWPRLAAVIGERLARPAPGRWAHYDAAAVSPSEQVLLAMDFYRALEARFGVVPPGDAFGLQLEGGTGEPGPDGIEMTLDRRRLLEAMRRGGPLTLDCSMSGSPAALLLEGWSLPEAWGTWSDGRAARLWLPIPDDGSWRIRIDGQGYIHPSEPRSEPLMVVSLDDEVLLRCRLPAEGQIPPLTVRRPASTQGVVLRLEMPEAVSPLERGTGEDSRRLALGLERIELSRVDDRGLPAPPS